MPKYPQYNVPTFAPTGNDDLDKVLEDWRNQMGEGYGRNLFEGERLPYVQSTYSTQGGVTSSTVFPGGIYLSKTLQLRGTETVLVTGTLGLAVFSQSRTEHYLKIAYPNGSTRIEGNFPLLAGVRVAAASTLNNPDITVDAQLSTNTTAQILTTVTISSGGVGTTVDSTVYMSPSMTWQPMLRQQQSGLHTFSLKLSTGNTRVEYGGLVVLVI